MKRLRHPLLIFDIACSVYCYATSPCPLTYPRCQRTKVSQYPRSLPSLQSLRSGGTGNDAHEENTDFSLSKETYPPVIDGDDSDDRVLFLMDGLCPYHGGYLAHRVRESYPGVTVVHVLSDYLFRYFEQTQPEDMDQWTAMRVPRDRQNVRQWQNRLADKLLVGIYCESDSGLADAEALRKSLNVQRQDDPCESEARRDKYLMNQAVGAAGMAVVQQKLCDSEQSVAEYANELLRDAATSKSTIPRVVVKPRRGVASESVHLCQTVDEALAAYRKITSTKVFGTQEMHVSVVVQEFLDGDEFALDVVARDGGYKVAAVWKYDKRPANGAPFCYFQTRLVDDTMDERVEHLCDYVEKCLSALGVRWGLSHNEVIFTRDGPKLVEINCRQHNMDFCPLTMACLGYNALDLTLEAMLGSNEDWNAYPRRPLLRAHGCMVHLVNFACGNLVAIHHMDEIGGLASVLDCEIYDHFATKGESIQPTTDIRTDAGWVQMISEDAAELQRDYGRIIELMPDIFEVGE